MAKLQLKQLMTNADNKLSTTATVQFLGFIAMAVVLVYSVYLDRMYVPELFNTFAIYCGGLVMSKGAVTAYRDIKKPLYDLKETEAPILELMPKLQPQSFDETDDESDLVIEMLEAGIHSKSDKPTIKELREMGITATAKERDEAWEYITESHT